VLKVEHVSYSYGSLRALEEVSLNVGRGEVVSLLGMNGAGKTTLLSIISGLLKPGQGQVSFEGRPLTGLSAARIVEAGVVQVPEGRQVFAPLTVRENLELGAYLRLRRGGRSGRAEVARDQDRVLTMFPALERLMDRQAGMLSGGEQQMLAMGRALMAGPRLLLLDEPSLGLAPMLVAEIFSAVRRLPESGASVLLVEQNALGALAVSGRAYIITQGRIRHEGSAADIMQDELLREAFLGPERAREACESEDFRNGEVS
jgi:branched-chain amino acid transport system ATP-binding protein